MSMGHPQGRPQRKSDMPGRLESLIPSPASFDHGFDRGTSVLVQIVVQKARAFPVALNRISL
jgi:hypothetical protein